MLFKSTIAIQVKLVKRILESKKTHTYGSKGFFSVNSNCPAFSAPGFSSDVPRTGGILYERLFSIPVFHATALGAQIINFAKICIINNLSNAALPWIIPVMRTFFLGPSKAV